MGHENQWQGQVWITDAIAHTMYGDDKVVSVTKVCAVQQSAPRVSLAPDNTALLWASACGQQLPFRFARGFCSYSLHRAVLCGASFKQAILFAALGNMDTKMAAYPTARTPGGQPVVPDAAGISLLGAGWKVAGTRPADEQPQEEGAGPASSQRQRTEAIPGGAVSLPLEALSLTAQLAPSVYMGWWVPASCVMPFSSQWAFLCIKVQVWCSSACDV